MRTVPVIVALALAACSTKRAEPSASRDAGAAAPSSLDLALADADLTRAEFLPLLELAAKPEHVDRVAELALSMLAAERLEEDDLAPRTAAFVAGYRAAWRALLRERERAGDDWIEDDRYLLQEAVVTTYLAVFEHLPAEAVGPLVDEAADDLDIFIASYGIVAQVVHDRPVKRSNVYTITSEDTMRSFLYDQLQHLDAEDLIVPPHRTQEALARADLAQWFFWENDDPAAMPEKYELVELVATDDGDVYVFRCGLGDRWFAGVAGPYVRGGKPKAYGTATGSALEPIEARTPAEHAQRALSADR